MLNSQIEWTADTDEDCQVLLDFLEEHMDCFRTGTRVYGPVTEASDWDVCVLEDHHDDLLELGFEGSNGSGESRSLRLGNVNAIVLADEDFERWKYATGSMVSVVNRGARIKRFKELLAVERSDRRYDANGT